MGIKHLLNLFVVTIFIGVATGCAEKDLYDPDYGKEPLKGPDEYFGFETRNDVQLNVNYGLPGFTTLLEVYGEDPMEIVGNTPIKKKGVEAFFTNYTDDNGKYEGKMNIPTSLNSVYLYTDTWGLPRCVKLDIENGMVNFDMTARKISALRTASTRSYPFDKKIPYLLNANNHLYSLCKWGEYGNLSYIADENTGKIEYNINDNYVVPVKQIGNESIGDLVQRLKAFFNPLGIPDVDNSRLFRGSEVTNVTVKQDDTTLDVVFLNRDADYNNTFGYYYYRTDEQTDMSNVNKYIVFPNVSFSLFNGRLPILSCGDKVRLLYFDENGKASEKFPKGYTVGWFIYANGYVTARGDAKQDEIDMSKPLLTSNFNGGSSFISVKDERSGKVIIGVEDGLNKSYCDLLFYVDASPAESIENPDRPTTDPDINKPEKPNGIQNTNGTLAFEDIWPDGGDYDMNDVIIEYNREVTYNTKNMVTKIVDTFTPVHDGALFANAFAYQIDKRQFGTITSITGGVQQELTTSSIIICPNVRQAIDKVYKITREFNNNDSFNKKDLKLYNPYIIVKYVEGQKNRTEVHLPKYEATSLADLSLVGTSEDAYYINKEGAYPFAIDIPFVNFIPVTEKKSIDTEYPNFKAWADSKGKQYKDWYNKYEKK